MPDPTDHARSPHAPRLTRRRLLAGATSGAMVLPTRPRPAAAQDPTPSPPASPPATPTAPTPAPPPPPPEELDAFMAISTILVGGGRLDRTRGERLLTLLTADPARRPGLAALLVAAPAPGAAAATPIALPPGGQAVAADILRFWYLGTFDGQPVADRATAWFGLSAWQAVPYTPAPSVCKAFGFWATEGLRTED